MEPNTQSSPLFPIAEPRFDEARKRLPRPERGLAKKRALSKRVEWDLATWREEAAPAGNLRAKSRWLSTGPATR
jgi:hypothetical protein